MESSIILYYSRSGNTEKLARKIQEKFQSDILKIEPEKEYGNYIMSCLRVTKDKVRKCTPAFITPIPDLRPYGTVFIGYPVWMQDLPVLVSEFVRQCDLKGKTVIPFATYGMTSISWTMKTLKEVCPGADIQHPFSNGVFKKQSFDQWVQDVNHMKNC